MVDNRVIILRSSYRTKKTGSGGRRNLQHLCLDKVYNSEHKEQELIKRRYVLHIPPKIKKDEKETKVTTQQYALIIKSILQKDGL